MNIPKAVEILNKHPIQLKTAEDHDSFEAIQLGIEALKRIKEGREQGVVAKMNMLPGETPEPPSSDSLTPGLDFV